MDAVAQLPLDGTEAVIFARDQDAYQSLPALVYPDGTILTEWSFTEEERTQIARGENLRLWIAKPKTLTCTTCGITSPCHLQPVKLELTHERIA